MFEKNWMLRSATKVVLTLWVSQKKEPGSIGGLPEHRALLSFGCEQVLHKAPEDDGDRYRQVIEGKSEIRNVLVIAVDDREDDEYKRADTC